MSFDQTREQTFEMIADFPFEQLWPGFSIGDVRLDVQVLTISATATALRAACPTCGLPSDRLHSHYIRSPRDLPISGYRVQLRLHVRRFRCLNPNCPRATFAERLTLLPPWAQQTARRRELVQALALAVSAEAGARLSNPFQIETSPAQLIHMVWQSRIPPAPPPRQIGLDDWALRKGRVYGTIIVDLLQHRPIDLLPDRTAATVTTWLQAHPSVELVARDRRTSSIRGITDGAPQAIQVADRWHLLANMRDAVEQVVRRRYHTLESLPGAPSNGWLRRPPQKRSATEVARQQATRDRRINRHQTIRQLAASGMSYRAIARRLGVMRRTVERYAQAETVPTFAPAQPVPSILDPYLRFLQTRWVAGCTNAAQLWREIQSQGYRGGYRQVARWTQQQRLTEVARPATVQLADRSEPFEPPEPLTPGSLPPARQLTWVLVRHGADLEPHEQAVLLRVQQDAEMALVYELSQRFQHIFRTRAEADLVGWLSDTCASGVKELRTFASGLQQDIAAVSAALSHAASNGMTEGHVNRLKLIKRQGYGRAQFDLLRQRVLAGA
jgi:transposase